MCFALLLFLFFCTRCFCAATADPRDHIGLMEQTQVVLVFSRVDSRAKDGPPRCGSEACRKKKGNLESRMAGVFGGQNQPVCGICFHNI